MEPTCVIKASCQFANYPRIFDAPCKLGANRSTLFANGEHGLVMIFEWLRRPMRLTNFLTTTCFGELSGSLNSRGRPCRARRQIDRRLGPVVSANLYFRDGVTTHDLPQLASFERSLVYRFTKTYTNYPVVRASNFFHR